MEDREIIKMVNDNYEIRRLERNLRAISRRRKKGGRHVQDLSRLRRKP